MELDTALGDNGTEYCTWRQWKWILHLETTEVDTALGDNGTGYCTWRQ